MKIKFLELNKHKLSEFTRQPQQPESLDEFLETFDLFYITRFNMFWECCSSMFDESIKLSRQDFIELFRSNFDYSINDGQLYNSKNYTNTIHGRIQDFEDVSPKELDSWVEEWEHYHIQLKLVLCELYINQHKNKFEKYIKTG